MSNDLIRRIAELEAELETKTELIDDIQRIAHIGHWIWDMETNNLCWSDEIYRIFGLAPQEFKATYEAFEERIHPEDRHTVNNAVQSSISNKVHYHIQHRIITPAGEEKTVVENGEVTFNGNIPIKMIGTVKDITELKVVERALRELAFRDQLTQIYNRRFFLEQLEGTVARCNRQKDCCGVIIIDLDNFSKVNNVNGHVFGDKLLREIAARITDIFQRKSDIVARYGGDEFVILVENIDDAPGLVDRCARLVESLNEPYQIEKTDFISSASVGITFYNGAEELSPTELLHRADTAMYTAKRSGKNSYSIFPSLCYEECLKKNV